MQEDSNHSLYVKIQSYLDKEMEKIYSKKAVEYFHNPVNMGRLTDPDCGARVKGICGDTMEMYLLIDKENIREIKFFTDGCGVTLTCGSAVTILVKGKSIQEALNISPGFLIEELGGLPRDGIHCAILSVNTLHKAIADYLFKTE
jgi:nitrogen fixation NifU-like protein